MKPFDIYHADFRWRTRNYPGFFLLIREVIRQDGTDWLCFAIASDDDNSEAFELNELDADFVATGLDHTSYVFYNDPYCRIPIGKFSNTRKGELQGEFLTKFRKESGL